MCTTLFFGKNMIESHPCAPRENAAPDIFSVQMNRYVMLERMIGSAASPPVFFHVDGSTFRGTSALHLFRTLSCAITVDPNC